MNKTPTPAPPEPVINPADRNGEDELVRLLTGVFGPGPTASNSLGIGDDAALLPASAGAWVWSVDAQVQGVHFELSWLDLEQLGFKATMAAASDLAAMGAEARGVLSALIVPESFQVEQVAALARGQAQATEQLGTHVLGGNLARGEQLSLTTTVLGVADRPLLRAGAKAGDRLWLAGRVGLAAAGLRLLQRSVQTTIAESAAALEAWRRPRALLAAGRRAAPIANAAIDISDGLACDVARLAHASSSDDCPVCIVLDERALVDPELTAVACVLQCSANELALYGGEDYALAVAAPPTSGLEGFKPIGWCEQRAQRAPVLQLRTAEGRQRPLSARGFDHFDPQRQ